MMKAYNAVLGPCLLVTARAIESVVSLTCEELGMPVPPQRVGIRFLRARNRWTVLVRWTEDECSGIERWATSLDGMRSVHLAASSRIIRLETDKLPMAANDRFRDLEPKDVILKPDGGAIIRVLGPPEAVAALIHHATRGSKEGSLQRVRPTDVFADHATAGGLLTDVQFATLEAAVRIGYYEIPRPVGLSDLARELDVSKAAVGERLRRAEAKLVHTFMDAVRNGGHQRDMPVWAVHGAGEDLQGEWMHE